MIPPKLIAIVDDDEDDRDVIKDAFASAFQNFVYLFFENGETLVQYIKKHPGEVPDLILLDLNMPGMDGREVLKLMKSTKEFLSVPVIVFTTSSSPHDRRQAYALGANCFASKPETYHKLRELAHCIGMLWLS